MTLTRRIRKKLKRVGKSLESIAARVLSKPHRGPKQGAEEEGLAGEEKEEKEEGERRDERARVGTQSIESWLAVVYLVSIAILYIYAGRYLPALTVFVFYVFLRKQPRWIARTAWAILMLDMTVLNSIIFMLVMALVIFIDRKNPYGSLLAATPGAFAVERSSFYHRDYIYAALPMITIPLLTNLPLTTNVEPLFVKHATLWLTATLISFTWLAMIDRYRYGGVRSRLRTWIPVLGVMEAVPLWFVSHGMALATVPSIGLLVWNVGVLNHEDERDMGNVDPIALRGEGERLVAYDEYKMRIAAAVDLAASGLVKGILLHGPPGTGKSALAAYAGYLARKRGFAVYRVNANDLLSSLYGDTEKEIDRMFDYAIINQPVMIIIDEVERFLWRRTSHASDDISPKIVATFLSRWDDVASRDARIVIVGTTNVLSEVDPATLRGGRFTIKIYVPYPDEDKRWAILTELENRMNVKLPKSVEDVVVRRLQQGDDIYTFIKCYSVKGSECMYLLEQTGQDGDESS